MGAGLRIGLIGACAALLLGDALPASASEFEYDLSVISPGTTLCGSLESGTSSEPIGGATAAEYPPPNWPPNYPTRGTMDVSAVAERGRLRARVRVDATVDPPSNSFVYGGCGSAEFLLDDLVATGPSGLESASLNLEVVGAGTGDYLSPPAIVTVQLSSYAPSGTIRSSTSPTQIQIGVGTTSITTAPLTFMAGDTFRANVRLRVNGRVGFTAAGSKSAEVDFSSLDGVEYGARFPLAGPVLNLPPGYTVDSVDGNIVDNQWLGAGDAPGVPGLGPLGAGLLAMALVASARLSGRRDSARF